MASCAWCIAIILPGNFSYAEKKNACEKSFEKWWTQRGNLLNSSIKFFRWAECLVYVPQKLSLSLSCLVVLDKSKMDHTRKNCLIHHHSELVITTGQLHSTKTEPGFCRDSNTVHDMSCLRWWESLGMISVGNQA